MTDQYLQEQHAYISRAATESSPSPPNSPDIDHKNSWVMLTQDKEIVRLPHEHIRFMSSPRVKLEIGPPANSSTRSSWKLSIDDGIAVITTVRIIYIPANPTEQFRSFAAPILNIEDSHLSSPWFGSWYWTALVKPVSQGGIPAELPRVEIKLTFREGGQNNFLNKFMEVKERLHHVREMERETGQSIGSIPDEQLPAYSSTSTAAVPVASPTTASVTQPEPTTVTSPNEPPPGYDEAHAQQVSMRLEDHIRQEAERE